MTKFYFHFREGGTRTDDELGLELASAEQAYLEAVAAARAMWPELLAVRTDPTGCAFEVVAEGGETLFSLPFSELIDACRGAPSRAANAELIRAIEETHARAQLAKAEIRVRISQVQQSLSECGLLLRRLSEYERPGSGGAGSGPPAGARFE